MRPLFSNRNGSTFAVVATLVLALGAGGRAWTASPSTPGDDWPQFRGPAFDGAASAVGVFENPVGVGLSVAWKKKLGSGYSSIAIAGGRVVTGFSSGESDFIAAFDESTGDELWRYAIGETYLGHDGSHTGPLATPLVTSDKVVGLGARGKFFALNAATGNEIWVVDIVEKYGAVKPHYGFSSSPILVNGSLVLELGAADAAVAGFDLTTGERVWTAGTDGVTHQNPALVEHGGKTVLVAAGQKQLMGIDPSDGTLLFEYDHSGGGARGVMSLAPVPAGDGRLFLALKDDASALVRYTADDDGIVFEQAWENRAIRNSYNVPVYHDGHIYAFSSRFLTCVDAATGETRWRSREPGDGFLLLVDGHLVIVTKKGGVHVVKASPDGFEELAGMEVFEDLAWSPPSFANGHIFVRSLGEIARIDIGEGGSLTVGTDDGIAPGDSEFGQLLVKLAKSDHKTAVIDRYFAKQKSFPVIEGSDRVHFVYRGPGDDVAVAGELFGARQERPMHRVEGTDLFYYSVQVEPDARTNYVFLSDYEQMLDPLNSRTTETTVFATEMEMGFTGAVLEMSWFAMPEYRAPRYIVAAADGPTGRVESDEWDSTALEETKVGVDVYLPAGYDDDGDRRYPVVYVHAGDAALGRGQWVTSLDNLVGNSVDPVIVVFVHSLRAPTPTYVEVFASEIVPKIDERYRTVATAGSRASVGMGFGAISALACALSPQKIVGKVAMQSAFMFSSSWSQMEPMLSSADEIPLEVYMDWGKYDLRNPHEAWDIGEQNRKIAEALRDQGYTVVGGEAHDGTGWSSWINRTDSLLEAMFPMKHPG